MKERPILFSSPMVRAIMEDRKTQTRRLMKLQPSTQPEVLYGEGAKLRAGESFAGGALAVWPGESEFDYCDCHCPYGEATDRLWVRETWQSASLMSKGIINEGPCFRATGHAENCRFHGHLWRPSIFMPRALSRITLEITGVRVERLNDISHLDALAEGAEYDVSESNGSPLCRFQALWESINGKDSWKENPYVWVIEFNRISGGPSIGEPVRPSRQLNGRGEAPAGVDRDGEISTTSAQ
jgi:hypothetical protein